MCFSVCSNFSKFSYFSFRKWCVGVCVSVCVRDKNSEKIELEGS